MKKMSMLCKQGLSLALMLCAAVGIVTAQTGAAISVAPTTLEFNQVKGGKFAIGSFAITNTGTATLSGSIDRPSGPFHILTGGGSFELDPGEIHIVTLRFTSSSHKMFADSLAITHNASGSTSPIWVHLRGTAADSSQGGNGGNNGHDDDSVSIGVTPGSLNFGNLRIGQSAEQTVTITNRSDSAQLVGAVGLTTNGAFLVMNGAGAFSLSPGESRAVTVRFMPTTEGTIEDSLVISYNGTSAAMSTAVMLRGSARAPVVGGDDSVRVMITPASGMINFGTVVVGRSSTRSIRITNHSDSAQVVGTVETMLPTGSFALESGMGAFVLQPGESRTVSVRFTPTAAGTVTDSFHVMISQMGTPVPSTVTLTGRGIMKANPGQGSTVIVESGETVDFGNVNVGGSTQGIITLRNPTEVPITGTVHNPASPFFVVGGAGTFTLNPNGTHTVFVNYAPSIGGNYYDNLVITYNDATLSPTLVTLNGNAAVTVSNIAEEVRRGGATDHLLAQNFPNPFATSTRIEFMNPTMDHVRLTVFNVQGETVATLVDEQLPEGPHAVIMEAGDLESGVYMYRLETGPVSVVKRLTVVR